MLSPIWPPPVIPSTLERQVVDSRTAAALPGVGRALALYGGLIGQLPWQDVRGSEVLSPTPRVLQQPDVDLDLPTYVNVKVREYLLHGNTVDLVTSWDRRSGLPAAVKWFPAHRWQIVDDRDSGDVAYYLEGRRVDERDVIHHQRGADERQPGRGIGIVEQHLRTLDRAGLQEEYERETLRGGSVPSVAIVAPQKQLEPADADRIAESWEAKFGGAGRRPGIFPNGTTVTPLSWSPSDQQLVVARKLTLSDLANVFNLDGYWLGAEGSSHTYRSPAGMFVALLRTSLEPVMQPLEAVWSNRLLPYGRRVRLDRLQLTQDDFATAVTTGVQGRGAGLFSVNEWRTRNGMQPIPEEWADDARPPAAPAPVEPEPDEQDDPDAPEEQPDGPTPPEPDDTEETDA